MYFCAPTILIPRLSLSCLCMNTSRDGPHELVVTPELLVITDDALAIVVCAVTIGLLLLLPPASTFSVSTEASGAVAIRVGDELALLVCELPLGGLRRFELQTEATDKQHTPQAQLNYRCKITKTNM